MAEKTIEVSRGILDRNDRIAAELRDIFASHGVCCVNLLSGPGAGKTTTIIATIKALAGRYNVAVIEGDIASDVDALKVKEHGAAAVQINTGGICHLEGDMIKRALDAIDLDWADLVIIENVGNLVCTVDFDLGADLTAMILSVPEGHDKIYKYPGIFQASQAVIVSKVDTMGVFDFDDEAFDEALSQLNPTAEVFRISSKTGQGMDALAEYLAAHIEAARAKKAE